jgi:hypothetical protein
VLSDFRQHPLGRPATDVFNVDGRRFQISISTRQRVRCRCFSGLMVGTPGSPAHPKGPSSMFLSVDSGRSRISINASQGARRRCYSILMVDAPGSPSAPPRGRMPRRRRFSALIVDALRSLSAPPRGPVVNVFQC